MKLKKTILLIILSLFVLATGCTKDIIDPITRSEFYLGTVVTISLYDGSGANLIDKSFTEIERLENLFSKSIKDSDIYKINTNAGISPVEVSPETIEVLEKGMLYYEKSKGLFDISIGPLVDLWKIGTQYAAVPRNEDIEEAVELVGGNNIIIDGNTVFLKEKGMRLDVGAIAKGYIADRIAVLLKENGCTGAIINLGGNVLAVGEKSSGEKWKIGIQDPFKAKGEYMDVVFVTEMSVVTSGPYERYFEENGVKYHHILNPFTGYPIENNIVGISIVSVKSIDGDGLSTAVFALGLEKGMELIEKTENTEGFFILADGEKRFSSGFEKLVAND